MEKEGCYYGSVIKELIAFDKAAEETKNPELMNFLNKYVNETIKALSKYEKTN